jgi:heat-inducible transcriptional repressor
MKTNLNAREQRVLWATINHYIATAEPVGSKVLAEEYKFDISAATIRSVMGVLDKSGLLYQPHTSAGRIPSDSGYRVYVDELINPVKELNYSSAQHLSQKLESLPNQNLEVLLRNVAQILATFSGCIALITAPNMQNARIKHLQLVKVESPTLMLIAVMDSYHTASVVMKLPSHSQSIDTELEILNNFLNTHLRDRSFEDLTSLKWDALDQDFRQYAQLLRHSLQELNRICNPPQIGQIFISGLTELLRQPEFTQLHQVQAIIQLLEEDQASLFPLIFEPSDSPQNRVTIRIGSEMSLEPIQRCALISSTYTCDQVTVGSVGVLGPTRIDYERAIASVQAIATHLSETISQKA